MIRWNTICLTEDTSDAEKFEKTIGSMTALSLKAGGRLAMIFYGENSVVGSRTIRPKKA